MYNTLKIQYIEFATSLFFILQAKNIDKDICKYFLMLIFAITW